ncbi:hypothetical protein [Flavisolibacter tropicus]|uniref:hypothetical protein n=1 Tax=Flavisolibacter tropicus TaxID=1492898 RepID=UPI0011E05412|nr:hypothetical protein [Flavisolibacter tropicus]
MARYILVQLPRMNDAIAQKVQQLNLHLPYAIILTGEINLIFYFLLKQEKLHKRSGKENIGIYKINTPRHMAPGCILEIEYQLLLDALSFVAFTARTLTLVARTLTILILITLASYLLLSSLSTLFAYISTLTQVTLFTLLTALVTHITGTITLSALISVVFCHNIDFLRFTKPD